VHKFSLAHWWKLLKIYRSGCASWCLHSAGDGQETAIISKTPFDSAYRLVSHGVRSDLTFEFLGGPVVKAYVGQS
jgi:hypothetical protein